MDAINLRVEYLKSPIGLGIRNPRIMWNCSGGIKQKAYQIKTRINDKITWDSGKVLSEDMEARYPYLLNSRDRVEYSIKLWDEFDIEGNVVTDFFEINLLEKKDLIAKWICGKYKINKKKCYPVDSFKKEFNAKNITKARLYITACGLYEASINGIRVGDFILAPGHTDYKKRIQLQAYDVTNLINEGKNEIQILLADGWYRGSCGAWGRRSQYGKETKVICQLELYSDNEIIKIATDSSWLFANDGPIRMADNQDGEIIDANLSYHFNNYAKETVCKVFPTPSNNVYITEHEKFKPILIKSPSGKIILDFKQNIAGYISFKINAKKGQIIKLRMGELIDECGEFTQKNIQCRNKKGTHITPLQEIVYKTKDGLNEYKTKFAIFGFQYVLVEADFPIEPNDFTAIALYSNLEETLEFNCSNKLINKFVENTYWSAKNNHADVPTDCPTRERHAWTGDAQIFTKTASYLFNYMPLASKYIKDMEDDRRKNGCFRQISPKGGTDFYMSVMDGSAGWSDAGILIPYRLWKQYGDINIIKDNYEAMKKYAMWKIKTLGKWYLTALPTGIGFKYRKYISNYGQSYGEWCEPIDIKPFKISDFISPHPEETTAYITYMLEHMVEIAKKLDKDDDAKYYQKYADKARIGYQKLVETKKYNLDSNRQAKLVRPLYMHLLTKEQEEFAKKRLIKALTDYKWRLGTGFLSTPFILYVLEEIDLNLAYKLLLNEEMPGWLYMPKVGANTIWESWEGPSASGGVASLNHYSKGAVCEWIFTRIGGIIVNGKREFLIAPKLGGNINYCSMKYKSIYGEVSINYEVKDDYCKYEIIIPSNTKATLILNDNKYEVLAGCHEYKIKMR